MEELQVMGFGDVFFALPRLIEIYRTILRSVEQSQPDGVLFVDYPGLNLRLAAALHRRGYKGKLIHYIAPTVWAWGKGRIEKMARTLDLLLVILPFEPQSFAATQLAVEYVGHPLLAQLEEPRNDLEWRAACGIDPQSKV